MKKKIRAINFVNAAEVSLYERGALLTLLVRSPDGTYTGYPHQSYGTYPRLQGTINYQDRLTPCQPAPSVPAPLLLSRPEGAAAVSVPPPPPEREVYYGVLGGTLPDATDPERPLFLHPGTLSIASLGGRDVPPFSLRVQVPEPITWTNRAAIHTIDRSRDLTLRWDLRAPRQPVLVAGVVVDEPARVAAGFLCRASAAGRQFTIPAPILQSLPPSRTAPGQSRGFLFLATFPAQGEYFFQESGLDGLLSIAVSLDGRTVRYR